MWKTRPVRLPEGGGAKIAGVAEGIGVRYQCDPTFVRIIFFCLLFTGLGFPMYLLAWMLMPKYSLPLSPVEALFTGDLSTPALRNERNNAIWLIIVFFLFGGFTTLLLPSATNLVYIILIGLAWWGLHNRTPEPPTGLLTPNEDRVDVDLSNYAPVDGEEPTFRAPTPPSWDPLGAAPGAWHLPDPAPEPKKRNGWRSFFIGIAISVVATVLAFAIAFVAFGWLAWKNDTDASRSWIAAQSETVSVTSADELEDLYRVTAGDFTLDLEDITAPTAQASSRVEVIAGDFTLITPSDAPINVTCTSIAADCPEDLPHDEDALLNVDISVIAGSASVQQN